jgi:hypothetical protein
MYRRTALRDKRFEESDLLSVRFAGEQQVPCCTCELLPLLL